MILVDDRVGSAELLPLLANNKQLCHLEYADFAFYGNGPHGTVKIGVERKAILDLISSMSTGRLSGHQLIGLKDTYDYVYLLVEGVWRANRKTGILDKLAGKKWQSASKGQRRFMARDIWNYLQSLQIMCGVLVARTTDKLETARWLDATYGWWSKPWDKHTSHLQWQKQTEYATLAKPSTVVRMASQLDGIGWDRARKIGERFRTVLDMVLATREEWMRIEGIGKGLASSVVDQIYKRGG